MRFFVAITDFDWFTYLAAQKPDEVNFWQPSGNNTFRALQPGEPLLFKLHSPRNYVVGGGFFSHFSSAPLSFAWDAFREKNGAKSLEEMRMRVWKYRNKKDQSTSDEVIGCILLQQPFFFREADWIPVSDWAGQIVRGKGYDTQDARGDEIWKEVENRLMNPLPIPDESVAKQVEKFGKPQIVLPRLGQGAFRMIVADSYDRACALSSSHIFPILDAAHIRPYAQNGTHSPTNGLLLRQDIHTLFDRGYLTVTPEYKIEVSSRIKGEFNNGTEYYRLHGQRIRLPALEQLYPAKDMLSWHNENVYKGSQ